MKLLMLLVLVSCASQPGQEYLAYNTDPKLDKLMKELIEHDDKDMHTLIKAYEKEGYGKKKKK